MECDKDLIIKYQILLENEKRRLMTGQYFNLTDKQNNRFRIVESQTTPAECDKEKCVTNLPPDNESTKISTTILNKQIVPKVEPKTTKIVQCESNLNKEVRFCFCIVMY